MLEGRLLLYYKSQQEYARLSPCRGSLNMGLASCVRPGAGPDHHVLEVVLRSHVVSLVSVSALGCRGCSLPLGFGLRCLFFCVYLITAGEGAIQSRAVAQIPVGLDVHGVHDRLARKGEREGAFALSVSICGQPQQGRIGQYGSFPKCFSSSSLVIYDLCGYKY